MSDNLSAQAKTPFTKNCSVYKIKVLKWKIKRNTKKKKRSNHLKFFAIGLGRIKHWRLVEHCLTYDIFEDKYFIFSSVNLWNSSAVGFQSDNWLSRFPLDRVRSVFTIMFINVFNDTGFFFKISKIKWFYCSLGLGF